MRLSYTLAFLLITSWAYAQQPTLVKDIFPGSEDANPTRFFPFQDKLIFRADSAEAGVELWISDGTETGTFMVRDINSDPGLSAGNSNPDNFTVYQDSIYFKARAAGFGDELWVTDGTPEGTRLVADIFAGEDNSNPFDIVVFQDLLYFTARDGEFSSEMRVSDGTAAGTQLLIDIQPGGGPGNPNFKTVVGDRMYFTANDGVTGNELWSSDGTAEGTQLIKDIRDGGNASPSRYIAFNGEVYFRANDGVNGTELWKTDGTAEGTVLVKDIAPGSSSSSPTDFIIFQDRLLFVADDDVTGDEIWTTDGTEEGTYQVLDMNTTGDSDPGNFLNLYDISLIMTASPDGTGEELLSFFLEENEDGTVSGDFSVFDIVEGEVGSEPEDIVFTGYALYFSAETAEFGRELYELSVFESDPVRISDINPEVGDGTIDDITLVDSTLFFEANDGVTGDELWKYEAGLPGFLVTSDGMTIMSGDTIDLGDVILGSGASATLDFALENPGTQPTLVIEENLFDLSDPFAFDNLGNTDYDSIPALGSIPLQIVYTPTAEGEDIQEVNILAAVLDQPNFTFFVRGAGVAATSDLQATVAATAFIDGDTLDFGDLFVTQDSVRQVVLRNEGNVALNISGATLDDGTNFAAEDPVVSLLPGATDTIAVTFKPQTEGQFLASLTISSDAIVDNEFVIVLQGAATVSSVRDLTIRDVRVFPNPSRGQVTIELDSPLANGIVRVFDMQGKLMHRSAWPGGSLRQQLQLDQLPRGQYQVEIGNATERGVVTILMH